MFVESVDIHKRVCYNQIIKESAGRKARPEEKKKMGKMTKLVWKHRELRRLTAIALENLKAANDENYADALLAYRDARNKADMAFDQIKKAL